jgi:hypothetical protein
VPSEAEAAKAVQAMVGEEAADSVHLAAFLTGAKNLVLERKYANLVHISFKSASI